MEKLLTYGIQKGGLVHISCVPNGLLCDCLCPACGENLIAVANIQSKKFKTLSHFRHSSGVECRGAYESALHILAKEVL